MGARREARMLCGRAVYKIPSVIDTSNDGERACIAGAPMRGEEPIGVIYGFTYADRFYFYQSGISMNIGNDLRSPGIALNLLLMKQLAAEGVSEYDFMRGSSAYKTRHATTANRLVRITLRRQNARMRTKSALEMTRTVVRYFRGRFMEVTKVRKSRDKLQAG